MTFRCPRCHATVWVQPAHRESHEASICCEQCGRTYVLQAWSKLRNASRSLAKQARQVADDRGIDLPSAYSVVLGVVSPGELEELGDSASTACRTAPQEDSRKKGYDPDYQPAIDEGLLTPRQARERGKRSTYGSILASRHKLSQAMALDVADNRISLLDAIRQRPQDAAEVQVRLGNRTVRTIVLGIVLVLLVLIAGYTRDRGATYVDREAGRIVLGAEVKADRSGRIVQVRGPNPRSVLRAYCAASDRARFEPLSIAPSSKPGERARVGLLRDPRRPEALLAITIREDREAGQWLAGEGNRPLLAESAPPGAEEAIRRE